MYPRDEVKAMPNSKEMCPVKIQNKTNFILNIQILGTKVAYCVHHTDVIILTFSLRTTTHSDSRPVLGCRLANG